MFSILPKHLFWLKILSLFEQHRSSSFTLALDPHTNDDTRQLFQITFLGLGGKLNIEFNGHYNSSLHSVYENA